MKKKERRKKSKVVRGRSKRLKKTEGRKDKNKKKVKRRIHLNFPPNAD